MQVWSTRRNDLATCFLFNSPKDLPQEGEGTGLRPAAVFLSDTFFAFWADKEIDSFCITYSYFLKAGEIWCHIFTYSTWFVCQQCIPFLCPVFFSTVNYLYVVWNTCSLKFLYFTHLLYLMWCSQDYYINSIRVYKCEDGFFLFYS